VDRGAAGGGRHDLRDRQEEGPLTSDGRFPATRRSVVLAVRSGDPEERGWALAVLVEQYWKPVYKYLRVRHRASDEDAQDLTQGFFARALDRDVLAGFEPAKGSFRTFLRVCLDRHAANERKAARRQKRGGGAPPLALDWRDAEGELRELAVTDGMTPDEYFHQEWVRSFFGVVVEALRAELAAEGKAVYFTLFERYDLECPPGPRPTYAELAAELGVKATDVTNHLASARRRFRRLALARLRELCASDEEFEREAGDLLGGTAA
jgi:RNA polymerase sigma factor (sigma-70 family)